MNYISDSNPTYYASNTSNIVIDNNFNSYSVSKGYLYKFDKNNNYITNSEGLISLGSIYNCCYDSYNNYIYIGTEEGIFQLDANNLSTSSSTAISFFLIPNSFIIPNMKYIVTDNVGNIYSYSDGYRKFFKFDSYFNLIGVSQIFEQITLLNIDINNNILFIIGQYAYILNPLLNIVNIFTSPSNFGYYQGCLDNLGNIWLLCTNNTILKYNILSGDLLLNINFLYNTGCYLIADIYGNIYIYDGNITFYLYSNNGYLLSIYTVPFILSNNFTAEIIISGIYNNSMKVSTEDANFGLCNLTITNNQSDPNISVSNNSIYSNLNCVPCNNNKKRGAYYGQKRY